MTQTALPQPKQLEPTSTLSAPDQKTTSTPSATGKAGFLQDDNGNNSCIRLMSFIGLLSAIAFSVGIFWQTSHPVSGQQPQSSGPVSDEFLIVLSFLSVSFGGKVIQKFAENTPDKNQQ